MLFIAALLTLQTSNRFPFVIPWDDSTPGTATDMSFLNDGPAGKNGRIVVTKGVFTEHKTGKRIKFFGTNLAARAAFPPKADADKIAARLAKLGINLVRMHHLQNEWDKEGMIWKTDKVFLEIDPKQLDKFDYFIAALKKHGIYTNINLTTTRKYLPEMGFPASVKDIQFDFAKKIDKVDPKMISLQKDYARAVLDRKNPYTGNFYKDEPALAIVEINNENSLVGWPGESLGAGLQALPEYFLNEVVSKWDAWLTKKYQNTALLKKAWLEGMTPLGDSIVSPSKKWSFENQSSGDVQFEPGKSESKTTVDPFDVTIKSNNGPDWHVQAHVTGLDFTEGETYTVKFTARSDKAQHINLMAGLDENDWHNVGLGADVELTPAWKKYSFTFVAKSVRKNHNRIAFVLGNARGKVAVTELSVSPGSSSDILAGGTSLEANNLGLPNGGTPNQMRDYAQFLLETEKAFSDGMRSFLLNDLGIRANLIDTQVAWGGLTSLVRESNMEFADNHAYWQHPNFLSKSWDPKNWVIQNQAMVNLMDSSCGELGRLAKERVIGKPYSISEYNHPAPNEYRAEMMPLLSTFAAAQDWDIFYTFDYGNTGTGQLNDQIQGFFDTAIDPTKVGFFPAAALAFRKGLVPKLSDQTTLVLPTVPWLPLFTASAAWSKTEPNPLVSRIGVSQSGEAGAEQSVVRRSVEEGGTSILSVSRTLKGAVYLVDGETIKSIVGFAGGREIACKDATFIFDDSFNSFVSVMMTSKDSKPLTDSTSTLLTLIDNAENPGMKWNAAHTSVSDQWGHGPVEALGISCSVKLKSNLARKVWALDATGKRVREVNSKYDNGSLTFQVDSTYKTIWFEIAANK